MIAETIEIGHEPSDEIETQAMREERVASGNYMSGTPEVNFRCMHDSCDCLFRDELTPETEKEVNQFIFLED